MVKVNKINLAQARELKARKLKVCNCCGVKHSEDSIYCPTCHECMGTCDWYGTSEELEQLEFGVNPMYAEDDTYPRIHPKRNVY